MSFSLMDYVRFLPFLAGFVALLVVYKVIFDKMTKYNDVKMLEIGYVAPALSRMGGYVGMSIATLGSLIGSSHPYWEDFGMFMLDGVIAIAFFALAMFMLDVVILPSVENDHELAGNNVSVGMVEAGAYIALGAIMCGAFSGDDPSLGQGFLSAVLYSALGLVTLCVAYKIFDAWYTRHHKIDIDAYVMSTRHPCIAADTGAVILSLGIVLGFSITGDSVGWGEELISYAGAAVMSALAIVLVRILARVLIPASLRRVKHNNNAEATISAGVTLASALLIGVLLVN